MRRAAIGAAVYAVAALGTFGYAAGNYQEEAWARYSVCQSVSFAGRIEDCRAPWPVDAPTVGLVSAILWPLYWSWVAVDEARR